MTAEPTAAEPTKLNILVVETGQERLVCVNGEEALLTAKTKPSAYSGRVLPVPGKRRDFQTIGGQGVWLMRAPAPPSHKQIGNRLAACLSNVADRFEDALDAARLDMPVQEIERRRKARLNGEYNFRPWNPCRVCGRETVPEERVHNGERQWTTYSNRRGYEYEYDVLGAEKYTCAACHSAGLDTQVRDVLAYYVTTKKFPPWSYHGHESPEFIALALAVAEWNAGVAYLDTAGQFRYNEQHGKPITSWNTTVKEFFCTTGDFYCYCEQRLRGPVDLNRITEIEVKTVEALSPPELPVPAPKARLRLPRRRLRWLKRKGVRHASASA